MTQSTLQSDGQKYKVIGTRPIRHDGMDKVTGRAQYASDGRFSNLLYGRILRSPHAHAKIKSIDTSAAEAHSGVHAVATGADIMEMEDRIEELGEDAVNLRYLAENILARDRVLYHGHPVAAVAAESVHIAEEALDLIKVEYEVLKPVLDIKEAMRDDAPVLLHELRTDEMGKKGEKPTNVAAHFQHARGDLDKGFAEADAVVEREFKTAMVHQGYIEPHSSTAIYNEDDHVEVWTSSQGPFMIRGQVADLLSIPVSNVHVTPAEIGGGFGGKMTAYTDVPAALLSKKAGHRPVKITMSRAEVLQATGPTSGSYIKMKMGAKKDGTITAAQASLYYESGAFPGSPVGAGSAVLLAPYRLENVTIDGYDIVLNKPKTSAYRAPGGTNAAFASESVIDELAEQLNLDPLEFRMKNAIVGGDRRADGPVMPKIGYAETLEAAMDHPHYKTPLEGKNRGRGVASGFWFNGSNATSVTASVNPDGTVNLVEGSADIGGTRATAAMMLAETLGIAAEDVTPKVVGTQEIGMTGATGGSSVTFKIGWSTYKLGLELREVVQGQLADYWGVDPSEVVFDRGMFVANGNKINFKDAAQMLAKDYDPITASVSIKPKGAGPGFATHIVDVEVDPDTGKLTILRYTAVQDVGTAIHPDYAEGQIHGGVAQGVGWALNEEYFYSEDGHLLNASLLDYRMPTALDLPMIDTVMIEVPNPEHPYGVRGVGEVPIVPPAGALANAIYDAVGVRLQELPMSPAKVTAAMLEKQSS